MICATTGYYPGQTKMAVLLAEPSWGVFFDFARGAWTPMDDPTKPMPAPEFARRVAPTAAGWPFDGWFRAAVEVGPSPPADVVVVTWCSSDISGNLHAIAGGDSSLVALLPSEPWHTVGGVTVGLVLPPRNLTGPLQTPPPPAPARTIPAAAEAPPFRSLDRATVERFFELLLQAQGKTPSEETRPC